MSQEAKIKQFDLEKHLEGKEEEKEREEKEELEEILEEKEEVNLINQRINNFLANQQIGVSLEKNDFVINDLESDLPPAKIEENDEEQKIEYMIKNEITSNPYNPEIKQESHFIEQNQPQEKLLQSQQKIMYSEAQKLSSENNIEKSSGLDAQIEYISIEDTRKKNDLSKKKFY